MPTQILHENYWKVDLIEELDLPFERKYTTTESLVNRNECDI